MAARDAAREATTLEVFAELRAWLESPGGRRRMARARSAAAKEREKLLRLACVAPETLRRPVTF